MLVLFREEFFKNYLVWSGLCRDTGIKMIGNEKEQELLVLPGAGDPVVVVDMFVQQTSSQLKLLYRNQSGFALSA